MRSRTGFAIAAGSALAACGPVPKAPTVETKAASTSEITGWGELKLGESFEEALDVITSGHFEPIGLRECLNELPIRGCGVYEPSRELALERKDGIPYHRSLSFNRLGRLTDIGLRFDKEGNVTPEQCLDVHGRTLDWLTREYGPFAQRTTTEKQMSRKSAGGLTYAVSPPIEGGSFVVSHARTVGSTDEARRENPIVRWDDSRYVSLFSSYIVVGRKASCGVAVDFSEPERIERATPSSADPATTVTADVDEVPVCDRPASPEKFALMNEIGIDCLGE